jgi:hypothetical protein
MALILGLGSSCTQEQAGCHGEHYSHWLDLALQSFGDASLHLARVYARFLQIRSTREAIYLLAISGKSFPVVADEC